MICDERSTTQQVGRTLQLLFGFAVSRPGEFQTCLVTHEPGRQQRAHRQRQSLRAATAKLTTARATSLPAASVTVTGTPTGPVPDPIGLVEPARAQYTRESARRRYSSVEPLRRPARAPPGY